MTASRQPEAEIINFRSVIEKQLFYGRGEVLEQYSRAWDLRTGEAYVFDKFFPTGGRLLDVGCGTGRTSFLLADRFDEIDAFDIVPEMIEVARKRDAELRTKINFFVGDATHLPVASTRYDAVLFAYNGIEGILDKQSQMNVLSEVFRVLRSGGVFIFTTKSCFNANYARRFYIPRLMAQIGIGRHDGGTPLEVEVTQGNQKMRWHTTNPLAMKAQLRRTGFELLYFNSEVRLGRGQTGSSLAANFHRWDHFYACRKP
ncbi:ubiquinone/menaquinone biosynthesis C-methylase UbiE [Microvirga lupini]|uniref:Ubiquinone/menaquinone biosynthesis C-methylase UbiE n=1 Tax=Microvirga lupini TaxID=420324 RepID=A0A7W4VR02_9HYPH|nr:class I SAM-dependent methyltransferase [Microvirga lupini]MBB3021703.1 ubiquinone/menaquinone biosynthesis C-methylase UbiE [Microvirga lupini]